MIVTVTLNAALDRTLVAPGLVLGTSRTAAAAIVQGGGKGLNVARALQSLNMPVLALGFAGGLSGDAMRRALSAEQLPHDLTAIQGESRTCTALIDPQTGSASEINEPGPTVTIDEAADFLRSFDRALPDARLLVLSGSLPPGLPDDFYALLIERARASGVPCLLDTRNAALRAGAGAAPLLIKPNQHEAAELLGGDFDPRDAAFVRRSLPHPGPLLLALTLGAVGAVLHGPTGSWEARPPVVKVVDTVGAGDCFVAGLAAALARDAGDAALEVAVQQPKLLESMLRLATATAVANTLTLGAGRCDPTDIQRLLGEVQVQRMS